VGKRLRKPLVATGVPDLALVEDRLDAVLAGLCTPTGMYSSVCWSMDRTSTTINHSSDLERMSLFKMIPLAGSGLLGTFWALRAGAPIVLSGHLLPQTLRQLPTKPHHEGSETCAPTLVLRRIEARMEAL
jgi:hypothetical protein